MVFEPNFARITSSARKNIGITQSVIELKLPTNEDMISAIYSLSAKSTIITTNEVVGNDVNFSGLVDFQAIYESEGISAVDYSAEFKDKFQYDSELRGEIIITSNVVDVTGSIVSGGLRVVAIVESVIDIIESRDLNVLTGVNGDAFLNTKLLSYNTYIGKASEKFDVSEEFEISHAEKILMVTPSVCLSRVNANDNFVTISGVLNIDICYKAGENNNDVQSINKNFDFNYDIALSGIESTSYIQSMISVLYNEIKVSSIINEQNATVSVFVPMIYSGFIFNKNELDVVDDVYTMSNYLSITNENFESVIGYPSIDFKDMISGTASISDNAPFIDEILGVCTNNIVLASSRVQDNKLAIEGVANATVVYYTKELNLMTAVQVEMPFSVEEKVEGDIAGTVSISLANIGARSKRGKEIEVSGDLCVYVDMYNIEQNCVISNISLGEEKDKDDCALYIYLVKPNDTLWDIAKEMNVAESLILEQNPEIELPLKGGEHLVIYKPVLRDYK